MQVYVRDFAEHADVHDAGMDLHGVDGGEGDRVREGAAPQRGDARHGAEQRDAVARLVPHVRRHDARLHRHAHRHSQGSDSRRQNSAAGLELELSICLAQA